MTKHIRHANHSYQAHQWDMHSKSTPMLGVLVWRPEPGPDLLDAAALRSPLAVKAHPEQSASCLQSFAQKDMREYSTACSITQAPQCVARKGRRRDSPCLRTTRGSDGFVLPNLHSRSVLFWRKGVTWKAAMASNRTKHSQTSPTQRRRNHRRTWSFGRHWSISR